MMVVASSSARRMYAVAQLQERRGAQVEEEGAGMREGGEAEEEELFLCPYGFIHPLTNSIQRVPGLSTQRGITATAFTPVCF